MSVYDWNDGELTYLERLVQTRGNPSVPRDAVASYLRVQLAGAHRDGRTDVIDAIGALFNAWTCTERISRAKLRNRTN